MLDMAKIFREAGFEVRPLSPKKMTLEEIEHAQKINQAVNDHLKKINHAYEASKHSQLKFCQPIARHSVPLSSRSRKTQRTIG